MTDEEPILTCDNCGCELFASEARDNEGLCADCDRDFFAYMFEDDPDDDEFEDDDDNSRTCAVCGSGLGLL